LGEGAAAAFFFRSRLRKMENLLPLDLLFAVAARALFNFEF
jgi:hypothetical protein